MNSNRQFYSYIDPLTANDEITRFENLTRILSWVPRSFATHISFCNTLSSNKLSKDSENPGS